MAEAKVQLNDILCVGKGTCIGGSDEMPDIGAYPMLAWARDHHRFGNQVFLQDLSASMEDVAMAVSQYPSLEALASHFNTTERHVADAISYAVKSGFLERS